MQALFSSCCSNIYQVEAVDYAVSVLLLAANINESYH